MGLIETIIVGVAVVLLATEVQAWLPWLTERILRHAVRRLPESLRDRYDEEWRADINDRPGMLSKFVSACGLLVAGNKLRRMQEQSVDVGLIGRVVNRSLGMLFVVLDLPLYIGISVWIYIEDRGPIFYKRTYIHNGKPFVLYEFRTRRVGLANSCESEETRAGRFLRRTELRLLPYLFNVVKGDMYIVGSQGLVMIPGLRTLYRLWTRRRK